MYAMRRIIQLTPKHKKSSNGKAEFATEPGQERLLHSKEADSITQMEAKAEPLAGAKKPTELDADRKLCSRRPDADNRRRRKPFETQSITSRCIGI